jgi:rubredoxin
MKKRKLLSLVLALTMMLAFAVPASAAATAAFVNGTVSVIDKSGYDSFDGKEVTANNSSTVFDSFSFIADNKTLNAWYIDVTDDISGTLEVAYKVGSSYYIVKFDIDGAGKYWIADSKGSNGANMVKIGKFVEKEADLWRFVLVSIWGWYVNEPTGITAELFKEIYDNGVFDFTVHLTNGYGDLEWNQDFSPNNVWGHNEYYVPYGIVDFKFDPSGTFDYDGYRYNWNFFQLDDSGYGLLNSTEDGMYFDIYKGKPITDWFALYFLVDRELITPLHVHDYTRGVSTPATCTEQGYTTTYCECGDYEIDYYPALGHDFIVTWNNGVCFGWIWAHEVTCNNCDYHDGPIRGFPREHIDAILAADDGSDFWYCPICKTYGSKDTWIMD